MTGALKGKKTYIVAGLMILVGIANAMSGDVTALQGIMDNAMIILNGLGFSAVRHGIR